MLGYRLSTICRPHNFFYSSSTSTNMFRRPSNDESFTHTLVCLKNITFALCSSLFTSLVVFFPFLTVMSWCFNCSPDIAGNYWCSCGPDGKGAYTNIFEKFEWGRKNNMRTVREEKRLDSYVLHKSLELVSNYMIYSLLFHTSNQEIWIPTESIKSTSSCHKISNLIIFPPI